MLGKENKDFDTSKKSLIQPIQAIDTLYNHYELYSGEEITSAKIGYYTSQPIASDEQTFAPTWQITVNGERHYFIHAIEGFVSSNDDKTFLEDAMRTIKNSITTVEDDKDFKEISRQLDKRLESIKRSEEE